MKKKEILILDLDFQSSIYNQFIEDQQNFANEQKYEVIDLEMDNVPDILKELEGSDVNVLMDLPGRLDDDNLSLIFEKTDLVFTPFAYDKRSFTSTFLFAEVFSHINSKAPMLFVPNRMKNAVKYETKSQVIEALSPFGQICEEVYDRVAFQRLDTLSFPEELLMYVKPTYDFIIKSYIK